MRSRNRFSKTQAGFRSAVMTCAMLGSLSFAGMSVPGVSAVPLVPAVSRVLAAPGEAVQSGDAVSSGQPAESADVGEQTSAAVSPAVSPAVSATVSSPVLTTLRIDGTAELRASVGMLAAIKGAVIPGPELTVRKVDPRASAIMLRIDNVYSHGDEFRYDLTWMAWEPGTHNLLDYLVRKDGSTMSSVPALEVTAVSAMKEAGTRLKPLQSQRRASAGGYRTGLMVAGVLWLIGLGFLVSRTMSQRSKQTALPADTPLTRLQQIEAQLQLAADQPESLSPAAKASLESLIVAFWREEKHLTDLDPAAAITKLRQDTDTGPLLAVLERWLYDRPERSQLNGELLLLPFRRYVQQQLQAAGSDAQSDAKKSVSDESVVLSGGLHRE